MEQIKVYTKNTAVQKYRNQKVAGRQGFQQSTQLSCVLPQILDRPPVKNGHKSNISYFCPHSIFVPSIFKSHLHILKSTTTEDSLNLNKDSLANLLALPNCDCPTTFWGQSGWPVGPRQGVLGACVGGSRLCHPASLDSLVSLVPHLHKFHTYRN